MSKKLEDFSFIDLVPSSIAADEQIIAAAQVLDNELLKLGQDIQKVSIWSRIDELEEPMLSSLAWGLHIDYWDDSWPDVAKRETIKKAYFLHMFKGTPAAVEEALTAAFGNGKVEEWFDYDGDPYHFRVEVDMISSGMDDATFDILAYLVDQYKNTRSWLDQIKAYLAASGKLYLPSTMQSGDMTTVYPFSISELTQNDQLYFGAALQSGDITTIYPPGA